MNRHILTPEAQAILLLCGQFGAADGGVRPLSTVEYQRLAKALNAEAAIVQLLDMTTEEVSEHLTELGLDGERIASLLSRGGALALAIEQWTNVGLWVITKADERYPMRVRARLGENAPMVLYGAGEISLLERGGVAIVGSRDADETALAFTQRLGALCAEQGLQVVSGGARGVDGAAMRAAFEAGGTVTGVLAEGVAKEMVAEKYRTALQEERLSLVSPFHPRSVFSPGTAMERNKYIYALADYAVVVSSDLEKGGTWAGATENLKQKWVPMFVREADDVPPGNRRLMSRGGTALRMDDLEKMGDLTDWLQNHIKVEAELQGSLQFEASKENTSTIMKKPASRGRISRKRT